MNYYFVAHTSRPDWGYRRFIMERLGRGYVCLYRHNDDPSTMYVCDLDVSYLARRKGLGTALLEECKDSALALGAAKIRLWVVKDSWMHKWYLRLGFGHLEDHTDLPGNVWLEKTLKQKVTA